jgi:hypothetical protein
MNLKVRELMLICALAGLAACAAWDRHEDFFAAVFAAACALAGFEVLRRSR